MVQGERAGGGRGEKTRTLRLLVSMCRKRGREPGRERASERKRKRERSGESQRASESELAGQKNNAELSDMPVLRFTDRWKTSPDLNRVVVEIDVYLACEKQSQDTRVQDLEEAKRREDAKEKNKQKKIKAQTEFGKFLHLFASQRRY